MALGVGYPLVGGMVVGWLFLVLQEGRVAEGCRQAAQDRLAALDEGFRREIRDREIRLLRHLGSPRRGSTSLADLEALWTADLEALLADEFFLFGADGRSLSTHRNRFRPGVARMGTLPLAERWRCARFCLERGWYADLDELETLFPDRPPGPVQTPLWRGFLTERERTFLETVARQAMNEFQVRHGFPALADGKGSDLVVAGLLEGGLGEQGAVNLAREGELNYSRGALGDGYAFPAILRGADGQATGFALITHSYGNLTWPYLDRVCRPSGDGEGWRLVAIPFPETKDPPVPSVDAALPFQDLAGRALLQPANPVSMRVDVDGEAWDAVARVCAHIPQTILVAATPVRLIEARLRPTRWRLAALIGLVTLFGAGLAWVTVTRFLAPVQEVGRGVEAMRARDFALRLPVPERGELADLYQAFNRAMVHLADMELAAVVQARLLPTAPLRAGGIEVIHHYQMTQATGGDVLERCLLPDGRILVALGDVSGHGIPAALVTAMAKAAFGVLGPRHPDTPEEILRGLNQLFLDLLGRQRFMTCLVATIEPTSGLCRLANAGQCFPLLIRHGQGPTFLRTLSYPLGVTERWRAGRLDLELAPERDPVTGEARPATLVFFTDGLVEAIGPAGEQVGFDRLAAFAAHALAAAPQDPGGALFAAVKAWTDPVAWPDDASALIIRVGAAPRPEGGADDRGVLLTGVTVGPVRGGRALHPTWRRGRKPAPCRRRGTSCTPRPSARRPSGRLSR